MVQFLIKVIVKKSFVKIFRLNKIRDVLMPKSAPTVMFFGIEEDHKCLQEKRD